MQVELSYSWNRLAAQLGCSPEVSNAAFLLITDCYTSVGRYYHNLNHVAACQAELAVVREYLVNDALVEFALWFHDIIYVPSSQFNEELSAAIGRHYALALTQDAQFASRVYGLIVATKHQERSTLDSDTQYLLDIDLAVLGYPPDQFFAYSEGIRREYSHLSAADYKVGRRQALEAFLKRKFIYHTEYFRSKYEQKARENIRNIIDS